MRSITILMLCLNLLVCGTAGAEEFKIAEPVECKRIGIMSTGQLYCLEVFGKDIKSKRAELIAECDKWLNLMKKAEEYKINTNTAGMAQIATAYCLRASLETK